MCFNTSRLVQWIKLPRQIRLVLHAWRFCNLTGEKVKRFDYLQYATVRWLEEKRLAQQYKLI